MSLFRRLVSQSAVIFGGRLFGAGLTFLVQAGIARFWGPSLLGEYLILVASTNLIAMVMPLGFQMVGAYFTSEYRAKGDGGSQRSFLKRAYGHIVVTALLLGFAAWPFLGLIGEPGEVLAHHWIPTIFLTFSAATMYVSCAVLVGLKRPLAGYYAESVFRPVAAIAAFIFCIGVTNPGEGFAQMVWIFSSLCLLIAAVQFGVVISDSVTLPLSAEPGPSQVRRWWRFAAPWVLIGIATDFFFDIDLLLLSGHLSREELAIFGVCTRLFSLVSFGVAAVYAVTVPDMFEAEAKSDREGFNRKVGDANLVAAGLSVILFIIVAIGGPFALMLFGPGFTDGALPLAILCLALVVRSVFGPASMVLSIHDRPYASLPSIALGMVTLVVANLVMVPAWGIIGAALAALLSITIWSLALWRTAYAAARIDVSIFPRLKAWQAASTNV